MPFNRQGAMRVLHKVGAGLGFDHEDLRDIASSLFRIPREEVSLAKLSNDQLSQFIRHLKGEQPGQPIQIKNKATARQLWKIRQLATVRCMTDNDKRLPGFVARQCNGKRKLEELTIWEASRVIEGLKNLDPQTA